MLMLRVFFDGAPRVLHRFTGRYHHAAQRARGKSRQDQNPEKRHKPQFSSAVYRFRSRQTSAASLGRFPHVVSTKLHRRKGFGGQGMIPDGNFLLELFMSQCSFV